MERSSLGELQKMTDHEIDTRISRLRTPSFGKGTGRAPARQNPFIIRLDEDVVEWFKWQGAGDQTKINAVLRSYVQAHSAKSKA
jgi:uncharacterized protein (DUF4415 family)